MRRWMASTDRETCTYSVPFPSKFHSFLFCPWKVSRSVESSCLPAGALKVSGLVILFAVSIPGRFQKLDVVITVSTLGSSKHEGCLGYWSPQFLP